MSTESQFLPPGQDDPFGRMADSTTAHAGAAPAGFWQRAGASILDALIVGTAVGVLSAVGGVAGSGAAALLTIVALAASVLYAPVLMARTGAANGQTWGKQALGIRVVREDGQPVTFGTGAVREIVGKSLLGIIVIPTIASIVMVAVRSDKKAIWDLLAGTRVHRA